MGGFIPLPSIVSAPSPPRRYARKKDIKSTTVHSVYGSKVQFGVEHRGSEEPGQDKFESFLLLGNGTEQA